MIAGWLLSGCASNSNIPKNSGQPVNKTIIYGALSHSGDAPSRQLTLKNPKTGEVFKMIANSKNPQAFIYELDPGTIEVAVFNRREKLKPLSKRTRINFSKEKAEHEKNKSKKLMYLPKGGLIYVGHWQFTPYGITVLFKKEPKVLALKEKYRNLDFNNSVESFPQ